jgi:hypothetical protein
MGLLEFPSRSRGAISEEEERSCHCSTLSVRLYQPDSSSTVSACSPPLSRLMLGPSALRHRKNIPLMIMRSCSSFSLSCPLMVPATSTKFYLTHQLGRWRDRRRIMESECIDIAEASPRPAPWRYNTSTGGTVPTRAGESSSTSPKILNKSVCRYCLVTLSQPSQVFLR